MNEEMVKSLEQSTVKELRKIATVYQIVGRHDMKKQELIDAIRECEDKNVKKSRSNYVDNIKIDDIVAFKYVNVFGKVCVISSRVDAIAQSKEHFILKDKNGNCRRVPREDILWVKTSEWWPDFIFDMLKGRAVYGEEQRA